MGLVVGTKMLRTSDGMAGIVTASGEGEARIVYKDRGEWFQAKPREEWIPAAPGRMPMRDEEIAWVANVADMALRSADENKPFAWWDADKPVRVYDQGLVDAVTAYLKARA